MDRYENEFDWGHYLDWLEGLVNVEDDYGDYEAILRYLLDTEFRPTNALDEDRAIEGLSLRKEYATETGVELPDEPCYLLEMLVALCRKIESTLEQDPDDDDPEHWFWEFLRNAGLDIPNKRYNKRDVNAVVNRIDRHRYKKNGEGWWFYIPNTRKDMRELGIWEGAMAYVSSKMKIW